MGRPPIGKKAMTAAERQRRRRARLKREAKQAARRAKSPYVTLPAPVLRFGPGADFTLEPERPPSREELADEIARQVAEALREVPGLMIEDVKAAIVRRFG